ncbi:hypothetical protein GCM10011357_23980 [Lacimicrobium alkaliphilum]|uniref:Sel1 repeat family protein n=2 Tax=Lacimicrobium alkaliphilum TaxID=1526571 RepID=A0ABQ1RIG3_9ALTE|nr:hypothetical protein GCM10011357_23980 [Lacimicrobium alkaliphilum]
MVLLVSSGQRYLPLLIQQTDSPHALYLGVLLGSEPALEALSGYARESANPYWLEIVAEAGDAGAYYILALNEGNEARHIALLNQSAAGGYAKAQYELALLTDSALKRIELLTRAAHQQYLPATISLYQWYLHQGQVEKALPWLEQAASQDADSALILARQQWQKGQYTQARQGFNQASRLGSPEATEYVSLIENYWPAEQGSGWGPETVITTGRRCAMHIQPVVTSLENMRQLMSLAEEFHDDKRLSDLPVCLLRPIWLSDNQLNCDANWQGNRRLGCDAAKLAELPLDDELSHILVLAPQGKANVHNGIMYLDLTDSYSVFVHELAHFAGFVDEYPLSSELAGQMCHPNLQPPNLIYTLSEEELAQKVDKWRQANVDWELAKSRTCNNHPLQAYKASSRLTFMEYHDQAYIPPVYLALWKQRLNRKHYLLPAHINIAQALEQQGKFEQAKYWWKKRDAFYGMLPLSVDSNLNGSAAAPD